MWAAEFASFAGCGLADGSGSLRVWLTERMGELTGRGFGLVIAYLLPGFVLLLGVAELSPDVQAWLRTSAESDSPTVGSFLYVLLASLTAGLTLSAIRWAVIDSLHHHTGIIRPDWNAAALSQNLEAFAYIVENHYRYYQFYANALVAILLAYPAARLHGASLLGLGYVGDIGTILLCVVLLAGSRDALRNYYARVTHILGHRERGSAMTNGIGHHGNEQATVSSPCTKEKPKEVSPAVERQEAKEKKVPPAQKK